MQGLNRPLAAWRQHRCARWEAFVYDDVRLLFADFLQDPLEVATEDVVAHADPLRPLELHRLALHRCAFVGQHLRIWVDTPQPLNPLRDQDRGHEDYVAVVALHHREDGGAHRLAHADIVEPLDPVVHRDPIQIFELERRQVVARPLLQFVMGNRVLSF